MALLALETKWNTALTSILEHLTQSELRKLLLKLNKIPQGLTDEKPRERLPNMIIQYYGTEGSISVIDKEMKALPRNDARVQEPLQSIVVKMKELKKRQVAKGKMKGCQHDEKKTSQLPAQCSNERKRKMDPVGAKKPKPKTGQQESLNLFSPFLKPAETYKMDYVGAKKPEQKTGQQESLNLFSPSLKPAETYKMDPVGAKKPKPKTGQQESLNLFSPFLKPAETYKMDYVGAKKPEQKTGQQESLNLFSPSLKPAETYKMDPVGAKKPEPKTGQQESLNLSSPSLKAAQYTKTFKVPSEAVQTGRIKITGIKSSNTRNTHLEVEFNGRLRKFYVTTRLLADAFGLKAEEDFKEIFSYLMPINAEAQIQGKKIIGIQNYTYL